MRYLLQATYRGDLQLGQKLLDTSTGMRRFVFNVPGSIGYVRGHEVDESVKAIRLLGALPDDPAFGLTLASRWRAISSPIPRQRSQGVPSV